MLNTKGLKQSSNINLLRSEAKQNIKLERTNRSDNIFSKFSKTKQSSGFLGHQEYLYFLTLLQMPLHYIVLLFDLVLHYGAALVLGVYAILLIEIGLPIFMLFVFMGSYCKKGYLRYWQCIPLLKGAGYTIALMTMTPEFINSSAAGLSLLYIADMFSVKIPWTDCNFDRVTNSCMPMNYGESRYINCTSSNDTCIPKTGSDYKSDNTTCSMFSALNYYRFNKENQYPEKYYEKLGPIKNDWAAAVAVTWLLIFIFMTQGFKSFQKIMKFLQLGAAICWIIVFLGTLYTRGRYHQRSALYYGITPAFNIEFWLHIFMHVCDRDDPGSVILLSSLGITMTPSDIDALIVYIFKLLLFSLLIIWVPILLQNVFQHYKISESDCLELSGFEIIFAVIPDILSRMPLPQLWIILWFLCIYIHSFASVLYTFTGAIEAVMDAFPKLLIFRIHICALLCLTSAFINMLFVTRLSIVLINTWTHYGMVVLRMMVLAMVTFALTFIYSISQIITDYHFAHGEPPSTFWIQSWKITPFLVLFETVFMLYHHAYEKTLENTSSTLVLMSYITAVIMLLPIYIVMLWKYCKHVKYQMVSSLVRPEEGWGYFIATKRIARKRFQPQKEVRYKTSKMKCKHQCLLNSRRLRRLQQAHAVRKSSIFVEMN